jgi:hypothetical protein
LIEFAQDVFAGIENADFETKRRILEMLKVRVEVNNGKFRIECLAGVISGDLRTLPKATKYGGGSGGGGVTNLRSPGRVPRGFHFHAGILRLRGLCLQIRAGTGC